jgi:SAM-dependent methyltransferase
MKSRLVALLRCPVCRRELRLDTDDLRPGAPDQEVTSGTLTCVGCGKAYPVTAGIPRLLAASAHERERRWTASRFGYLWSHSSPDLATEPSSYHFEKVLATVPLPPVRGMILDAGCGDGIDLTNVARRDGVEVVGVELSEGGVATAYARSRHLPNVHVVQADLRAIPLADDCFDLVYSYGVVHHLTPPGQAVRELARVARRGAAVAIYVYEDFATRALGLRLALRGVNSLRGFTTRLPPRVLFRSCQVASPLVYTMFTVPHLVLRHVPGLRAVAHALPYRHGRSPFALAGDLYDRFSAPVELRFSGPGTADLLRSAGLEDVQVGYERGWIGVGRKPS